jgi:hypothetical protein
MKDTAIEQMELGVRSQIRNEYRNLRSDRRSRAQWWFAKMRQVVEFALPPQPMATPRPEQTYLRLQ